jgi:RHS repeat-associated protein
MVSSDNLGSNNTSSNSVFGNSLIDDATLAAPLTESPSLLHIAKPTNNKNSGNYDLFSSLNNQLTSNDTTTNPNNRPVNTNEQSSLFNQPIYTPPVALQTRSSKNKTEKDILTGSNKNSPLVSSSESDPLTGANTNLRSMSTSSAGAYDETTGSTSLSYQPPKFTSFALVNDTAGGGTTNSDFITFDPTIRVTVPYPQEVYEWKAGFNNTPEANYVNILPYLQSNGVTTFDRTLLSTIYGSSLPDGGYALYLLTRRNEGQFQSVSKEGFGFILDTTPPVEPTFNLDAASDSGVIGDRKTNFSTVTLVGQTQANVTVTLQQTSGVTTSDSTGKFTFANVPLVMGDNSFTASATDTAGNQSTFSTTIQRLNPIAITLTGNTIAENSPMGTVIGQLNTNDPNTGNYTYTLPNDASGRFKIVGNQLQVASGTLLDFESNNQHTITVRSTDASNVSTTQEFTISVTNVNEAPSFTSTLANTNISSGSTFTYNIATTDPDALDTRTISAKNLPSWLTLTDNSNGTATVFGTPNSNQLGLFNFTLSVKDAGGLSNTQSLLIGSQITLTEQTNFTAQRSFGLVIPANPSILSFKIDPTFDLNDLKSINDAFEVALVDANGNSLVHTVAKNKDAFFNLTEGESVGNGAGATYNAQTRTVSLNLTGIKADTNATLIFRLVNNDSDTTTNVKITDFAIQAAPAGTLSPTQSTFAPEVTPGTPPNFNLLSDVSNSLRAEYHNTSFNADTKTLYADIAIRNTGSYSVDAPLLVAVKNISDPSVVLRNPDGVTPDGIPYYDFSKLVASGKLNPAGVTNQRSLVFYNPQAKQFTYDVVVLAQLNQKPVIESKPVIEIIGGKQYRYDVNATDPAGDTLTYKLLTSPSGMIIDATTGLISWNTVVSNKGNQSIVVEVSDGRGGVTQQNYTLSVIDTPPNRPPIFTSTPVVDAAINTEYKYDADATDPDADNLTYSLALGPEGMTVDPTTGEIKWTPTKTKVFGDTVIERIANPGESDTFTFGGALGERIYFDSLVGSESQTLQLYSPSGLKLIDSNTKYQDVINLTETGNYNLVISGATGDYGFSLLDFNAVPIATFDSDITGTLSPGSEDDAYRLDGKAGQRLYFDTLTDNNNLDWVIYDANNQVIASKDWSDFEVELPGDGQYTLVLRGKGNYNDDIPYSFRIISYDTNPTPLTLGTNSNPNTVSSSILKKGEQDVYTFTGTRGQRLYLDTISASDGINATLISPSGDRQKYFTNYKLDGSDSSLFSLEEDGVYRLVIDGDGAITGAYSFNLLNATLATSINLDTDTITNRLDPGKETHLYRLSTTVANQRLYLDSLVGSSNATWTLYNPSNQIIRTATLNTDFEVTLPTINTYTLVIQSLSDSPIDYQFRVTTPDAISTALSLGSTVSSNIAEKREQDIYTFSVYADTRLFLDALQESPNINARLVSPSLVEVFNTKIASDSARQPVILPETGGYQLIVEGTGETTGSYSFRLSNLSAATTLSMNTATTGTLNPGSSTNLYQFTGYAGNRLYLDSQIASGNATWLLYGPGNQLIDSKPLSDDFEIVVPSNGTYYLMLRGDGTTTAINYRIQVVPTTASPTALTLGSLVSSGISKLGEQDVYTFNSNTIGQRLYFDSRIGNSNFTARLLSPSGVSVWNGNTTTDSAPIVLVETGEYRLIIDGDSDTTGAYSFQLTNLASATSLTLSTTISNSLSPLETKHYSFNGTAGQRLKFDSLTATQNADWVLYAPDGSVASQAALSNDFEAFLPTNGTYILALRSTSASTAPSFSFRVDNISLPSVTNSGLGTIRSGSITTTQPVNNTFTASSGTFVYFDSQIAAELGNQVTARLLDSSNNQVFSTNAASDSNLIQLQQSGTYTLRLEGNGDYRYQLIDLGAAVDLTLNAVTNVSLNPGKAAYSYKFNGTVGQQLFYDALNSNNPNATVRLFTPSGRQILNTQAQSDSEFITLNESGIYYVIVSGKEASDTSVSFRLLDNSASGAASLTLDTNIYNTFSNGGFGTDLYRFNGTAGQYLYFDSIAGTTPNIWTLYGPSGQQLARNELDKDFEIALPSAGQYLLALTGIGGSVADYQFRVVTPVQTTTSISLGSTISGSISEAGEQDTYTFSGTAGKHLFFDSITSGQESIKLLSPSGLEIFNPFDSKYKELFTLAESGTYRIIVDAPGETTTPQYSFRLFDADVATLLSSGSRQNITVAANQTQLYRFSGTALQNLYLENNYTGTQSTWTLYGPGNQIITSADSGVDRELPLPASGTYILALNGAASGQTNYQFQMVATSTSPTSLTVGSTYTTSIGVMGEQDMYTFTGSVGQRMFFDSLTGIDALGVKIYSPSGAVIYNRKTIEQQEPFTLYEAGTYRVVFDGEGRSTGNYSFRLLDLAFSTNLTLNTNTSSSLYPASQAQLYKFTGTKGQQLYFDLFGDWNTNNGTGWAVYGPGNQLVASNFNKQSGSSDLEVKLPGDGTYTLMIGGKTNATTTESFQFRVTTPQTLTLGSTVPGSINAAGKQDIYTFNGTPGQRLFFDSLTGNSNIAAKLYSPNGVEIITWSTLADSNQPLLLKDSGNYRLVISGNNNNTTGNYNFRLVDLETVPTLTLNTPVIGRLDPGAEVDFYQFYAHVGQKFNFDLTAPQWTNANWVLYGPNNSAIATPTSTSPDFEVTPELAGTYVLAVRGSSSTFVDYNFKVVPSQVSVNPTPTPSGNRFVVMPGTGEKGNLDLDETSTYRVRLDVLDGRGGKAEQNFKIRVRPEPGNNSPIIVSDPITVAYTSSYYTYDVKALDSDNDSLTYSLIDAPLDMRINANTGRISWNAPVVGQRDVTVKVQDARGGVDTQTFRLNVSDGIAPGKITGKVYVGNGLPPTETVYFQNFESDTSLLTEWSNVKRDVTPTGRKFLGQYGGPNDGTENQGTSLTLNNLQTHDTVTVSFDLYIINSWDGYGYGGYQPDLWKLSVDGNPTPILYTAFGNYWNQVYPNQIKPGEEPIIGETKTGASEVDTLGYYPSAVYNLSYTFAHSAELLKLNFSGEGTTSFYDSESWGIDNVKVTMGRDLKPLAGTVVYTDQNGNRQRDPEELFTHTDNQGNYSFTLDPGNYTVAQETKQGWTQTFPNGSNTHNITVGSNLLAKDINFANIIGLAENVPPDFLSTPPIDAIVGRPFVYEPVVTDLNGDALTYDLVVKPDGMVVDSATGIVVWKPTANQVGEQDVLLRVRDSNGGLDLQSFKLKVSPLNNAPVFTSGFVSVNRAFVGQTYQYKFTAQDADGDSISYSLATTTSGAFIDKNTGLFTWTPQAGTEGSNTFTITISDGRGGKNNLPFGINVLPSTATPANSSPTITSQPRKTIALGQTYLYAVTAFDPDNDPLTYTLENSPTGMTIDSKGIISWSPNFNQLGAIPVTVKVGDGRGGVTPQTFNIDVVSTTVRSNSAPSITSVPNLITNIDREYQYNLTGIDSDGDLLLWSLDKKPEGMVIDANTGALRWKPRADQIGEHTVAVQLTDAYGAFVGQEFTLTVTGVNQTPQIVSTPVIRAALNQQYTYTVVATDPENDAIAYSLGRRPVGMTIDTQGKIQWTPTQVGSQTVEVIASDTQGATYTQTYTLTVGATAINNAPLITSTPVSVAALGSTYKYQVVAKDSDAGDTLTYQLLSPSPVPTGMSINATTGLLTWTNPVAGNYQVVVGAVDKGGLAAAQRFTLTARANNAPVINSTAVTTATPGSAYSYDVVATDVDSDRLTYTLDSVSLNKGMTIDALGRLRWTPTTSNVGTHNIILTVSDGNGGTKQQPYNLVVAGDTVAPKVSLIATYDTVNLGESVTFQARATDNIKVAGLQLLVNNQAVVLDANGLATFTPINAGTVRAKAVATDTAGNVGQATFDVFVRNPNDTNPPVVSFNLVGVTDGFVTAPSKIKATITDDGQLDYYRLLVAPINGGEFKEVWRNNNPTVVNNALLDAKYQFDPSLLQNDSYILRLEVADKGGHISYSEQTVDVAGELKLGNFRLSFTDLTVPVTGIPITLTRTYDTLTSTTSDDFGYGWRMEFRDTDLRTSLKRDPELEEIGYSTPFKDGTRVYITLPGGQRQAFTFKPTIDPLSKYLASAGRVDSDPYIYHPAFVADKGVTSTLTVKDTRIIHGAGTNQYYGMAGSAYNPEDSYYGSVYVLTTKEGVVYEIDAKTGDLLTVTDTNGNKLTYTDEAITSSTGQKITFERDASGRIKSVKDPMGELIRYEYDAQGDLVSVTDREKNTTRMEYNTTRKHYLDKIIDPLGRTGVRNEYGDDGRLKYIYDVNGKPVEMSYDTNNSRQTVLDQLGHATTYEYDARGNILTEIDALGQITKRKYDDNNYVLSETVISDRSGQAGFTTTYSYDDQGNKLTEEDSLGNVTRYTYGDKSRLLTETDALGRTTTNTYSRSGNLRSTTDATGKTTTYSYDLKGHLLSVTDANKQTTGFEYDERGNVTKVTDALGNVTDYTYNNNGDKLTEKRYMTQENGQVRELLTTWTYDNNGRMKTQTDAEQHTTTYEYDNNGHQTAIIDALQRRTEYVYNDKGELIETIYPDNTPNIKEDNPRNKTKYDAAGRNIEDIDEQNRVTKFVYDKVGRIVETIYADNTPNTDDDNPRSKTEYYTDGLVKAQIDERGNRTEYRYDSAGRQIEIIYADDTPATLTDNPRTAYKYDTVGQQTAVTDALNHTTSYIYDDLGRLTKTEFNDKTYITQEYDNLGRRIAIVDQESKRTLYRYDDLGRLTGVKNALSDWTTYGYNSVGNLVSTTDAEQHTTRYEYDGNGRRVATILPMSQRSTMTYDSVGNVKTSTDFNGQIITYNYDPRNRISEKLFVDGSKVAYTYTPTGLQDIIRFVGANGQTTATYDYDYDVRDRLVKRTDPDGRTIEYTYDVASNRTSVKTASGTVNYTFDKRNRLDQVIENSVVTADYDYDAVSNLISTTFANGTQEIRSYDDLNRLKYLENRKGNTVLGSYNYTLDKVGNRKKVVENTGRSVEYIYDDLYRLLAEKITDAVNGNRVDDYTYDKVGNRKTKIEIVNGVTKVTEYAYDANDRLQNEKVNQQFVASYTYDNNGNTLTKTENGVTTEYTWDYENRLIAAKVRGAGGAVQQQMQYRYNDRGIRVAATVDGVETRYLVDEVQPYAQVLKEYSPNGAVLVEYVYGNDLIAQKQGNSRTYYHVDGLGSTRVLTDTTGNVASTYNYEAFGELLNSTGSVDNKYLFAGEQYDPNLDDYYLRARYYDPETGRFTRKDDFEGSLDNPVSLHKYLYANDNPVIFTDPTGFFSLSESAAANKIRDLLANIYGETANQALNSLARGGALSFEGLATEVAWNLAPSVLGIGKDFVKTFGRSPQSSFERSKLFRQALNLGEFNPRTSPNFAFADIRIGTKGKDFSGTLISLSGTTRVRTASGSLFEPIPGLVGNVSGKVNFMPRVDKFLRDKDSEIKILESVANQYIDNPYVKGKIYLFSERSPCGSCREVIREFQKIFPNIEVQLEWHHTLTR